MIKEEDLDRILSRSKELEESMSTISGDNEEFVKISKEYSDLKPIVDNINIYNNYKKEHDELIMFFFIIIVDINIVYYWFKIRIFF